MNPWSLRAICGLQIFSGGSLGVLKCPYKGFIGKWLCGLCSEGYKMVKNDWSDLKLSKIVTMKLNSEKIKKFEKENFRRFIEIGKNRIKMAFFELFCL